MYYKATKVWNQSTISKVEHLYITIDFYANVGSWNPTLMLKYSHMCRILKFYVCLWETTFSEHCRCVRYFSWFGET